MEWMLAIVLLATWVLTMWCAYWVGYDQGVLNLSRDYERTLRFERWRQELARMDLTKAQLPIDPQAVAAMKKALAEKLGGER